MIDLEYIKENWDKVDVNNKTYYFHCEYSIPKKVPNETKPGLLLELNVFNLTDNVFLSINDFKSHSGKKICEYIKNTINGQRSICWDNNKPIKFTH